MPLSPTHLTIALRERHVPDLSWRHVQVAAGCELGYSPNEMAELLCLAPGTVNRHLADAQHRIFDLVADIEPNHCLLGKWCREHETCCTRLAAELVRIDQIFA